MNLNRDAARLRFREGFLIRLREEHQGVRIRHSFLGMATAWLAGVLAVRPMWEKGVSAVLEWALVTGIVCLGAWLVIGLPIYWLWSRNRPWWSLPVVMSAGFVGGILPALPIFISGHGWPLIAIPGAYGAICAGVARILEQRFLRNLAGELTIH